MPSNVVPGVEVVYGNALPFTRRSRVEGGTYYSYHELDWIETVLPQDFLVDLARRVSEYTRAASCTLALVTQIDVSIIDAGWRTHVWFSIHQIELTPDQDQIDVFQPHPVLGLPKPKPSIVYISDNMDQDGDLWR